MHGRQATKRTHISLEDILRTDLPGWGFAEREGSIVKVSEEGDTCVYTAELAGQSPDILPPIPLRVSNRDGVTVEQTGS
ncbi:hypothetical protein [Phaffia rhodozyma]|uniref:Uncharacterized protein n=1 Tax=Phaffia rhodozyma TaxID=264483 RepID=A0A0F7SPP2_PHARH|nr:hypothetical protein [Phaffia rhodozyma]